MNAIKKAIFAATVAVAGFSTGAHATLIGDTITLTGKLNGTISSSVDKKIDAAVEFSSIANYLNFNFAAGALTVTVTNLPNNKYTFSDSLGPFVFSGFEDTINTLTLVSTTPTFNNFSLSDYSHSTHSITLDFSNIEVQNDQSTLTFNITSTAPTVQSGSAPEPATVALLGLGLLGVAVSRRKSGKGSKA